VPGISLAGEKRAAAKVQASEAWPCKDHEVACALKVSASDMQLLLSLSEGGTQACLPLVHALWPELCGNGCEKALQGPMVC
jgi:hypothetical protein